MQQKRRKLYRPRQKAFIFEQGWNLALQGFHVIRHAAKKSGAGCTMFMFWLLEAPGILMPLTFVPALLSGLLGLVLFCAIFLLALIFLTICSILLILSMGGAAITIFLLTFSSWLYVRFLGIHYRCPNTYCYSEMRLPLFICGDCKQRHSFLQPSVYGVWYHRCACGKKLPTLDWLGRAELERHCVSCEAPLDKEIGRGTNIDIPIIGGPAAGKTTYLVAATASLIKLLNQGSEPDYQIAFTNLYHQSNFEVSLQQLQSGRKLAKTVEEAPRGYTLKIQRAGTRVPKLLFFYDAAGEAFHSRSKMFWHSYYKYIRGMIFVVDPYAIPQLRRMYSQASGYMSPGNLDVEQIGHRLVQIMETYHGVQKSRAFTIPIAVVVTKVDILGLENELGPGAIQQWISNAAVPCSEEDAAHHVVRQFLYHYGLNNFVEQLEQRFATVRYFSCSSLGTELGQPRYRFQPLRVFEPLQWLLRQNGVIKP